jgi:hypothetical protein
MQKRINFILFALLALNICATTYLIYRNETAKQSIDSISFENDESLKNLVEKAVLEYNKKNFRGVYNLFDELAKAQMNDADTIKALEGLSKFSGKIVGYVHASSVKTGFKSGKNFYTVKYHAKFEGGTIEKSRGELSVTFTDTGTDKKLYYFGVNANFSN